MERSNCSSALGILYAEDFGIDRCRPPPPSPAPPAAPILTQADIDAACIQAVQAAEHAWSASDTERRTEALTALAQSLAEARDEASQRMEAVAEAVARAALTMLAGMLPHFCREHGDEEVRALLAHLAPLLASSTRLVIRVHPGLIDTLGADIAAMDDSLVAGIEIRPANLPPGDVRITWEDGRLVRDTAAILGAMNDSLAELGLAAPTTLVASGSMELAQ